MSLWEDNTLHRNSSFLITKSLQTVSKFNGDNMMWLLMLASTISVLLIKLSSNIITWLLEPLFVFKIHADSGSNYKQTITLKAKNWKLNYSETNC